MKKVCTVLFALTLLCITTIDVAISRGVGTTPSSHLFPVFHHLLLISMALLYILTGLGAAWYLDEECVVAASSCANPPQE